MAALGHIACQGLCIGSSCYAANNASTRRLADETLWASGSETILAFDPVSCEDCHCLSKHNEALSWPVTECTTTVVPSRLLMAGGVPDPAAGHDQGGGPMLLPPLGLGSRLSTMLNAAAFALKRGQGFQLSAMACPVEARRQPFCFFQPTSKCGSEVQVVEASTGPDYYMSQHPWHPPHDRQAQQDLRDVRTVACQKLRVPCDGATEAASMLLMWRALAGRVLRVQPDAMRAVQSEWLASLPWALGRFGALHVRRGDKLGELPRAQQLRPPIGCEYAAKLEAVGKAHPGQLPRGAHVFVASDELEAVLAELAACDVVRRNAWKIESFAAAGPVYRNYSQYNFHRLWAELHLLTNATVVVASQTSNVGRLVQVLRSADPRTLAFIEGHPSEELWRP